MSTTEHKFYYDLASVELRVEFSMTSMDIEDTSITGVFVEGTQIEFDLDQLDLIYIHCSHLRSSRVSILDAINQKLSDKFEEFRLERKETIGEAKADQRRDERT